MISRLVPMKGSSTGSAVYSRPLPSQDGQTASSMVVLGTGRAQAASGKRVRQRPSGGTLETESTFAAAVEPRIETLRERVVAAVEHRGPVETIDETRRPLYRH